MKRKQSEPPRGRKLSFSVDREDIEISTDWATAVIDQCRPGVDRPHTATGASIATVAINEAVAVSAPGVDVTAVVDRRALKPLRTLADGLTPGQFTLYTVMYQNGNEDHDGERVFRGGYSDLGRLTGLSKRGIQNIVDALIEKKAVSVDRAPGYYRTETTVYRVYPQDAVFRVWQAAGYRYVVSKGRILRRPEEVAG